MGAAIRKYKNLLSKANQEMKASYKITSLYLGKYCNEGDTVQVSVGFTDKVAEVRSSLLVQCPWNFKAVEEGGYLYIGLDLSGCKIVEDESTRWRKTTYRAAFADEYFDSYYGRTNSEVANAVFNELQDRANNPKYVVETKNSIRGNLDVLEYSPTYRKYYKAFQQFLSDTKISVELKDGIHPGLSDRTLYPFVFIDLEDLKAIYLDGHFGRNSRQNRKVCSMEFFINHTREVCNSAILESPIENLIRIRTSSPFVNFMNLHIK